MAKVGSYGMYIAAIEEAERHMKIVVDETNQTADAVIRFVMVAKQLESLGKTLTNVVGVADDMKLIAKEASNNALEADKRLKQFIAEVKEIAEDAVIQM